MISDKFCRCLLNYVSDKGIDIKYFGELLLSSGIMFSTEIEWITFHSAYDFGYLLKVCTGAFLPITKKEFFDCLRSLFPHFYDMKYLIKFCDLQGGLWKVAEYLKIGPCGMKHQAGSDSLLTAHTFIGLIKAVFKEIWVIKRHVGILFGLDCSENFFTPTADLRIKFT
jgi:CCR4-NOT transcription complex subunit 7/8